MKLFSAKETATGYATDRPYSHPVVISSIKSYLHLTHKFPLALDVGCGAGMSSLALLEIADNVVGVDSSEAMINSAIQNDNIQYFHCTAEQMPFDRKFDLVTLAGSINWIDRGRFFSEARRVLKDENYVVIYDNDILGIMQEDKRFEGWYSDEFSGRFPRPPRDESPLLKEEAMEYGFEFEKTEDYTNPIQFDLNSFIKYLFTLSNITSVPEHEAGRAAHIQEWLNGALAPFFAFSRKTIIFGGYIWYLKKIKGKFTLR